MEETGHGYDEQNKKKLQYRTKVNASCTGHLFLWSTLMLSSHLLGLLSGCFPRYFLIKIPSQEHHILPYFNRPLKEGNIYKPGSSRLHNIQSYPLRPPWYEIHSGARCFQMNNCLDLRPFKTAGKIIRGVHVVHEYILIISALGNKRNGSRSSNEK